MATESVTTDQAVGTEHDIWLTDERILTITLNKQSKQFPPEMDHLPVINEMICDLARAANAVVYQAENDPKAEESFLIQPVNAIANAIILLTKLSTAVHEEASS